MTTKNQQGKTEEKKEKEVEKTPLVVDEKESAEKKENKVEELPKIEKSSSDVDKKTTKVKKKKIRRQIQKGQAYINSTYNNTVVSLTDLHGNLLAWSSAGLLGFKGAKKATTFAANQVVIDVAAKVEKYGLKDIDVFIKGVGSGRESAVRALAQKGFNLTMIKDKTPIPHNGCRPKKPRRV